MKIHNFIFLIIIALTSTGCPDIEDEIDSTVYIQNNSEKSIYLAAKGDSDLYSWSPLENRLINPNSIFQLKGPYKQLLSDGSKLFIWLFDKEVIDNTPWEEVVENNLYLVRYELTLEDLETLDWEIIYTDE